MSLWETKNLSNEYWDEAVSTAIYIMNWCLTKSVKNKVLQEAWTGMNHNISRLIFFGCVTYAHVPDELRKKLDKKGHKCNFVAYSKDTKSQKLYDPVTRKVIINRDVKSVENESWDGTVDTNVKIVSNVNNDDMEEEVVQTPHVSQPVAAPTTPMTP